MIDRDDRCDLCLEYDIHRLCKRCLGKIEQEKAKEGAVEELEDMALVIEDHVKSNEVWRQGNQYFEVILDRIEKRLKELEGKGE